MKKIIFNSIILVVLVSFLSGCSALYTGTMSGNAALSSNNFKVVKMVQGESTAIKILGFGGTSKDALVLEAKKNMLQNNPLREGQAMANVTVDFKYKSGLFKHVTKVIVTADIVEFKN